MLLLFKEAKTKVVKKCLTNCRRNSHMHLHLRKQSTTHAPVPQKTSNSTCTPTENEQPHMHLCHRKRTTPHAPVPQKTNNHMHLCHKIEKTPNGLETTSSWMVFFFVPCRIIYCSSNKYIFESVLCATSRNCFINISINNGEKKHELNWPANIDTKKSVLMVKSRSSRSSAVHLDKKATENFQWNWTYLPLRALQCMLASW